MHVYRFITVFVGEAEVAGVVTNAISQFQSGEKALCLYQKAIINLTTFMLNHVGSSLCFRPRRESAKSKSRSTAKSSCVCIADITETWGREIPLSRSLEFVAW